MKPCPFCAEEIQDAAVKCRFCNSLLTAQPPAPPLDPGAPAIVAAAPATRPGSPRLLFDGSPSWKSYFWPYVGSCAVGVLGLALAIYLLVKGIKPWYAGFGVTVAGVTWFLWEHLRRRALHIRITTDTIDLETGILSKRIDTIQLWRVRDIDFQQTLMERMLGVSTLHIISKDVENPNIRLRGVPGGRQLFADLKDAIAIARQGRNVLGMVD